MMQLLVLTFLVLSFSLPTGSSPHQLSDSERPARPANLQSHDSGSIGAGWPVEDAMLRFRIEKDDTYPQVPDVYLSELPAVKGPSDLKKPQAKGKWAGRYYRLNGKVYKKGIAVSAPATVVYKPQKEYGRFVALVGISDRADPNASVSFEVWADRRRLYKSQLLTRQMPPAEINVRIPSAAKELKLETKSTNLKGRRANWINAGFLLRGKNPEVGAVALYTPGYDPTDFRTVVFSSMGDRVDSRLLWTRQGEPMEIIFDSSDGWLVYFVYLVPKDGYKSTSSSWQPKAGLTLETRCANKIYPECNELSGLLRVWDEVAQIVGKSLVDSIHHGFPIHSLPEFGFNKAAKKAALALYRYEGFFQTERAGEHIFATSSNWASYLLVDGKLVVSWPGKHDYRGGIRGKIQGKIHLTPGVHKLEYLNCSPWGKMLTLAAWQRPREKLSLMTRGDFLPVRRYVVTEIGYNEGRRKAATQPTKHSDSFKWQVVDDWRIDQKAALVRMRFDVVKANPPPLLVEDKSGGNYLYRWKFDDGKIESGESIEHVFLRPGPRTVTLEVLKSQEVLGEVTHIVHAHPLPDKVHFEPINIQAFEKAISETDFSKVPIGDLVNLYAFADGLRPPQAKQQVVAALVNRVDELVAEPQHQRFCLKLGQYLRSAAIQQYKQALELFTRLREKSTTKAPVRQLAVACEAKILTQCFGKAKEALEILNQIEQEKNLGKEVAYRLGMAKAEALVALGEAERAREILQNLRDSSKDQLRTGQELKDMGMLRHARLLAEHSDDPVQLDYAMEKIEAILANDPVKLLTPSLNLIRLDIHLARKEYKIAFYLAERAGKLGLSNYYRLEVLARQVKALCGIKAVEQAKAIYEAVAKDYPHSPAVAEAKKIIVEAVMANQKQ
ncbi:MAG: NPCBM/NEW2 domain-containing protein [Sedimentisphaerales bacterium]